MFTRISISIILPIYVEDIYMNDFKEKQAASVPMIQFNSIQMRFY